MAEKPVVVHIGENSPEKIAYDLMLNIANVEGIAIHNNPDRSETKVSREWILDLYSECIKAVNGGHSPSRPSSQASVSSPVARRVRGKSPDWVA
jgi:hypothetical protein